MSLSEIGTGGGRFKAYCEQPGCSWADWRFRSSEASRARFDRHLKWRHGITARVYSTQQQDRFIQMHLARTTSCDCSLHRGQRS